MRKLHKIMILGQIMLLSLGLNSCDNEYDLTKNLNTDITIGTQFTIPVGQTEKILLNRLIKTGDNIKVNNSGTYEMSAIGKMNTRINEITPVKVTGFDPILKDIKISINDNQTKLRNIVDFNSEFTNSTNYDININLPTEVETLSEAELSTNGTTPIVTMMSISLLDIFPQGIENIYLRDLKIIFPEIFNIQGQASNMIHFDELILSRNNPVIKIDIKFESIKLSEAQQAKYIVGETGNKRLVIDSELEVSSKINIPVDASKIDANELTFRFKYSAPSIQITKVAGTFIPNVRIEEKVALNDIPDFIKNKDSKFGITDIALNLDFNNTVNMQLSTNLFITAWDDKQNIPVGNSVEVVIPEIKAGMMNKFLISNTERTAPTGSVNIVNPKLVTLLDNIPDSYKITSGQIIARSITSSQNFQLGKSYDINGDYSIVVPFTFNNLDITYTDSIDNLLTDLKDVADLTKGLYVSAEAVSTLPTDLAFSVKMLDVNRHELTGIIVDLTKFQVSASVNDAESVSKIEFKLTEKEGSNDLTRLDKIVFDAKATSLDKQTNIELKPTQYIFVKNIVVKVPNGLNVNL